jgi:hypothetical protein
VAIDRGSSIEQKNQPDFASPRLPRETLLRVTPNTLNGTQPSRLCSSREPAGTAETCQSIKLFRFQTDAARKHRSYEGSKHQAYDASHSVNQEYIFGAQMLHGFSEI